MDHPSTDETAADTSLTTVLDAFAAQGFDSSFTTVADGGVRCGECGSTFPAADLAFTAQHRLEGASDPADAMLVVGGPCPVCGAGGVLTVGYGPGIDDADADVVGALPEPDAPIDPLSHEQ